MNSAFDIVVITIMILIVVNRFVGPISAKENICELSIKSDVLTVTVNRHTGLAIVVDDRTGQKWQQYYMKPLEEAKLRTDKVFASSDMWLVENAWVYNESIVLQLNTAGRINKDLEPIQCSICFDDNDPTTIVYNMGGLDTKSVFDDTLVYPAAFHSLRSDLNWVIPKGSGLLLPSMDLSCDANKSYRGGEFYHFMGPNMAFFGAVNRERSDGYLIINDTPDCSSFHYGLSELEKQKGYLPALSFFGSKNKWSHDRCVRVKFIENGGYVAIAKEYQNVAKQKGYYVSMKQKAEDNANAKRCIGAHRIDPHIPIDQEVRLLSSLKDAGIENVMIKMPAIRDSSSQIIGRGDPRYRRFCEMVEERYGYVVFEYGNLRDVFLSEGEFAVDPSFVDLAKDYRVMTEKGEYLTGWVDQVGNAAYVLCPQFSRQGLDYWLNTSNMSDHTFSAIQFDCLGTCTLDEGICYDTDHLCDREMTKILRADVCDYAANEKKFAIHTEGAQEYLVPNCLTFEGSLGVMGVEGVSPSERIPLWELVFHGAGSLYYHWEHGNLTNDNRYYEDLWAILYGEPQVFLPYYEYNLFSSQFGRPCLIDDMIERILKINMVLDKVKYDQMVKHEFLTDDCMVQKTVFSSGIEVVANFSADTDVEYRNIRIKPCNYVMIECDIEL